LNKLKIMIVAAARPNFMKVAPIVKQLRSRTAERAADGREHECVLVHTGQHYDASMSDVFFEELGIPVPAVNLGVGSGSHAQQVAGVMLKFEELCQHMAPDWVLVVGDVNSTMACTLVCAKLGIKTAHIEAGLRSFDRSMPEEINRLVTDALADLLFTTSVDADANLLREGVDASRIHLVGNVMIDSLVDNLDQARQSKLPQSLGLDAKQFAYVTLHRPSNVDGRGRLRTIMASLSEISRRLPVVFPIHPRTRKKLDEFGLAAATDARLHLIEPIGYHDSLCLTESARFVLTDSGGIQEESTYLRTPCLTLRPNTERPITVTVGTNRLTDLDRLQHDVEVILGSPAPSGAVPRYWDGQAAGRIVDVLLSCKQAAVV
jgi:UDP-N-acetylglucosamine 2-epimerase (non-hydrolysing)